MKWFGYAATRSKGLQMGGEEEGGRSSEMHEEARKWMKLGEMSFERVNLCEEERGVSYLQFGTSELGTRVRR